MKPPLLSLAEAERLDAETLARLATADAEPRRLAFVKGLGLDRLAIERAEGAYCFTRDGRRILDFFAAGGALTLGHGHPRIAAARRRFHNEAGPAATAFSSHYAAALAHNLAAIAPGELDTVLLAASRGEAMETALSLAQHAQGKGRARILRAGSDKARRVPAEPCLEVPFGDMAPIQAAVASDPAIGIVVAETIETAGLVEARDGFWLELRTLCDRHGILWIADEVNCAVGRTGRFFAFQHEGVAPDIAAAGGLGASSAVAAAIVRGPVHARARRSGWAPPGGGAGLAELGEACSAAIEALHVLYDEGLIESAAGQGDRLMARLEEIAARHPQLVRQVRGRGLMAALELHDLGAAVPFGLRHAVSVLQGRLEGSLAGFVSGLLLRDYGVLTGASIGGNLIRLEPPLGIDSGHIDRLAEALDDLLSRGAMRILADVLKPAAGGRRR